MKKQKQLISLLLAATMSMTSLAIPVLADTAGTGEYAQGGNLTYEGAETYAADAVTGTYGVLTYTVNDDGTTCTITGCDESAGGKLTIPSKIMEYTVTTIGSLAFCECSSLTSITIENGVTTIEESAFVDCSGLTNVTIPDSVISIGEWGFGYCSSLADITIPSSVNSIGFAAFGGCESLVTITVSDANASYSSQDGVLFNKNKTVLVAFPGGKSGTYTIPNSVNNIENFAFDDCINLTAVIIPNSVESLGDYAFSGCNSITDIDIPGNVTNIGEGAFNGCVSLANITIPYGIASVKNSTFYGCNNLESITIPLGVTSIGEYAFWQCENLSSIILPKSLETIEKSAFNGCEKLADVYYGGSESYRNNISVGENNENLTQATWHYNYTEQNSPSTTKTFTFGKDNFSFTNWEPNFFTQEGIIESIWKSTTSWINGKNDENEIHSYEIYIEDFVKLAEGMKPVVVNRLRSERYREWGGSCYGMTEVAAIRYIEAKRLPIGQISDTLSNQNTTYDLKKPALDSDTESLINYYQLKQFLPVEQARKVEFCTSITNSTYASEVEKIVEAVKGGTPVVVSITQNNPESGHAILLIDYKGETEDYYVMGVCDPSCTEETQAYLYKTPGETKNGIRFAYSGSQKVNTNKLTYDKIRCYESTLTDIDTRNYFGQDDYEIYSDYTMAQISIDINTDITFNSSNVSLVYKDGVVQEIAGMTEIPSIYDTEEGGQLEFYFDKEQLDDVVTCTISSDDSYARMSLIADGWSTSLVSENAATVTFDNQKQSVSIESDEDGYISSLLTQNEPMADWGWYGMAVDVDDTDHLTITPDSKGVAIESDNLEDAIIAVNNDSDAKCTTINTSADEVLIQKIEDSIGIEGAYTIALAVSENGTVSPEDNVSIVKGQDQTFTFTPDDGYAIADVLVDGASVGAVSCYTFENVSANHTVEVTFQKSATSGTGWKTENGKQYWYENGIKQGTTGRGKEIYDPDSDAWYWLDAVQGGAKAVSKDVYQESAAGQWADRADGTGKWVRYDANGHMVKGWQTTGTGTYYFDPIYGTMAKGYATIDGKEYYFNTATGVLERELGAVPANGWKTIDGGDYWYENYIRQGYSVDSSYRGKEIYDSASDAWYWLDNIDGGKKAVSKDVYQESEAGPWADRADGTGKWVRYDANGHMVKGWQTTSAGTYYFDPIYGTMAKGAVTIDGQTYRFDEATGVLK